MDTESHGLTALYVRKVEHQQNVAVSRLATNTYTVPICPICQSEDLIRDCFMNVKCPLLTMTMDVLVRKQEYKLIYPALG